MYKKIAISILICFLLLLGGVVLYQSRRAQNSDKTPTITPTAVLTVSVSPPAVNSHTNWNTFSDTAQDVSYQYPENLSTQYIRTQNWPPKITVTDNSFSCNEGGQIAGQPMAIQKTIGNTTYCIKNVTQGAAGTMYTDYTYTFAKQGKLITLQFTIAYPQCDNYPDPKKSECNTERQTFHLDTLIDQIAQTISFPSALIHMPSVSSPQPSTKVSSPLVVEGTVPSGWMFEGEFLIKLLDSNKNVIAQSQAKEVVPGSWSSGKEAKFTATLDFSTSAKSGYIELEKDNPSGQPANADSFESPIIF